MMPPEVVTLIESGTDWLFVSEIVNEHEPAFTGVTVKTPLDVIGEIVAVAEEPLPHVEVDAVNMPG
jgi:hypothetical protein